MRNVLYLALLVPILALAAGTTQPITALAPEGGTVISTPAAAPVVDRGQPNIPPRALVGTLDTIGGTTYDWWANGPIYRMIVNAGPTNGVHAVWMYCPDLTGQGFPNRSMRYNYYEYESHMWLYADPSNFMDGGVNVFPKRSGYGNVDADPATGVAVIGGHVAVGADIRPWVAKDASPGAGIFEYADSMDLGVTQWPPISVGQDGTIHILAMTPETGSPAYQLNYSHIAPGSWPNWSTLVTGFEPGPGFPTHNIAASKVSSKVAVSWVVSVAVGGGVEYGFVDFSTDGGANWDPLPTELDPPAVFGGDTSTSYHISSIFPWYDRQDKFHIVANLAPCVAETVRVIPSHIYHYCPDNDPQWSLIHIATADTFASNVSLGYNVSFACRPSIGEDNDGNLFVAWEQFDSLNYEPATSDMRADIFASGSSDGGHTWTPPVKLTDAGSYSMRFPSVIDLAVDGGSDPDTVFVIYEADSVAGFYVSPSGSPEGPATHNPVLVQKIPLDSLIPPGVAEQPGATPVRLDAVAKPNPFGGRTVISYALPRPGDVSLVVYDAVGRPVQTLASGRRAAGRYSATWDARNVAGGVYFYALTSGSASVTKKLILTH